MKSLAVILLAAASAMAADFMTGQAARAVIGQPTFTAQLPDPSDTVLGGVSGLAYANGMLIVADANRVGAAPIDNRVLIYRDVSGFLPAPGAAVPQGVGARCPLCAGQADVVLGQPDFASFDWHLAQDGLRTPNAVATDGVHVAVADTDNNRVLIWNSIPTGNGASADVVIGQPDFTSGAPNAGTADPRVPSAKSLRGPQGVWIQDGRLFVADDLNQRVLIWNSIPTSNFQSADLVLGQPDFNTAIEPDLTKQSLTTAANLMLNPVAVSSDGVRLFVTDLGNNRVLIWNSMPTQNQQSADVVVGQPDMTTAYANYTGAGGVCAPTGQDEDGNDVYPSVCGATLDFPRFALSDGTRLFIADGGNDRVLIFNQIPATNGASADVVLGQISDQVVQTSDSDANPNIARRSSSDSMRSPQALAWDGTNLYVSDPFDRRVLVFSPGVTSIPVAGVRNAASLTKFAVGAVTLAGSITEDDEVTITINDTDYTYKILKDDTFDSVVNGLVAAINAGDGDPWVLATANLPLATVILTSRVGGEAGNSVTLAATTSSSATITAVTNGTTLTGGSEASEIAPGTLASVFGDNLSDQTAVAPATSDPLPTELGGVQVYVDGMAAPLLSVSPDQVNFQIPWEVNDSTSVSCYIRTQHDDGTVTSSAAVAVPIVDANPGVFAMGGQDPRPLVALHGSSQAIGTVIIEGSITEDDVATVTIEDRSYSYTVTADDTLYTIRDNLVAQINASDPEVTAEPTGQWSYIRLIAKVFGPEGEGIPYSASASGSSLTMTTTKTELCCANIAGALVTDSNPAVPGETIIVFATGLGLVAPDDAKYALYTGYTYKGPEDNHPNVAVNAVAGGKTAGVYFVGAKVGTVGVYQVEMELNPDLPTNAVTQAYIAQSGNVSNIVVFPVQSLAGTGQ